MVQQTIKFEDHSRPTAMPGIYDEAFLVLDDAEAH